MGETKILEAAVVGERSRIPGTVRRGVCRSGQVPGAEFGSRGNTRWELPGREARSRSGHNEAEGDRRWVNVRAARGNRRDRTLLSAERGLRVVDWLSSLKAEWGWGKG